MERRRGRCGRQDRQGCRPGRGAGGGGGGGVAGGGELAVGVAAAEGEEKAPPFFPPAELDAPFFNSPSRFMTGALQKER